MNDPMHIDLNGPWHIRPDPDNIGLEHHWHATPGDPTQWQPISVPSGWQTVFGVKDPPIAWYRRSVNVPREWTQQGSRVWLRFDTVATDATVWVNGREVGRHIGNWAPFHFDVTDALRTGKGDAAEIAVRVDKIPATSAEWIDGAPVFGGHITKGFHDVLSLQTAGIWDGVRLERTGGTRAIPNGISVIPDVDNGLLNVGIELERCDSDAAVECTVLDPAGKQVARAMETLSKGARSAAMEVAVSSPRLWSPDSPELYTVRVRLVDKFGSDEHTIRTGFRKVCTGGPNNERLLLNGRPIFLSGILDWGHEPRHITPTPPREELRERFAYLKEMGFNCVCLCMWYPPEYFFEIADEMGMMLWQEHPVWKPWMGDELVEAFKEQLVKFFRRDANHASVVLVSGSCEHERFNAKLAEWWWAEAKRRLPDRAHQIQTAFFAWTDPNKTDLWDEHTYESAGRWVRYLDDLQLALKEKTPKPFIMGESIVYTSWPDVAALMEEATKRRPHANDEAMKGKDDGEFPWWYPKGFAQLANYEASLRERYGDALVERFRAHGDHYHLQGRKFQMERYRAYPNHAGHVQNHLRDVPGGRLGFQDDLGRWRFTPEQTRPWLGETILLLETPDQRRGFFDGQVIKCRLGVSNFGKSDFVGPLDIDFESSGFRDRRSLPLRAAPGEVAQVALELELPGGGRRHPSLVSIRAASRDGHVTNSWTLHGLPGPASDLGQEERPSIYRLTGLDFVDADDMYPDFEEHAYSSGWGLKVRNWVCPLPNPAKLLPDARPWRHGTPIPDDAEVIVAHKLTDALVAYLERGGRVVHLTSKTLGSVPNQYVSMWGQVPLLVSDPFLGDGTDDVLIDLLDYDLTRRTVRSIPTGQLGIADSVEPLVRLVWTHDMSERPKLLDSVFAARVGSGLLVVSSLDHTEDAGLWLLDRLIEFSSNAEMEQISRLYPREVRRWTVETMQR